MAVARGDWLMVLDADDQIAPGRARRLLDAARDARADIVADNFRVASQKDPGRLELHIAEELDGAPMTIGLADYIRANLLFSGVKALGYLKPMFRRDFLAEHALAYPPAMRIGEDYALVAEAMARGARYIRVRAADYTYVTREGSISHRLNAADLRAMIDFDRTFLAAHHDRLSPDERAAAEAHLDSLLDGAAFTAMIDGLKARRLPAVALAALRRPSAIRHFSMPIRARLGLDAPRG
jgi:succinoglycan biosynthesis protein ExoO